MNNDILILGKGFMGSKRNNIRFVHISTGCMFHDKDKAPDYFNLFYSRTKIYSTENKPQRITYGELH